MTPSSFIIVTDRGGLKAYRVNETPTRGPSLQLVQAFNITDAHGRFVDKVSDLAGRFPVTNGAGAHHGAGSIAERTQLATETDRRIHKELADQITKIVSPNGKEGWSFAAPAVVEHMQQADVFCLPTRGDAAPWAVLEAMACGTPVISTTVGGIPDLLGGCGVSVPPGDLDALRAALDALLGDADRRHALGLAARARCEREYDVRTQGPGLVELLREAAEG